jgi:hypothetical protein
MTPITREELVERAKGKPLPPYSLDERMTFFCPQENLEALDWEVVKRFHDWGVRRTPAGAGERAVLLLMPCEKVKPYALSPEHRAINGALHAAGFAPSGRGDWPEQLAGVAEEALMSNAPLAGHGLRIDRAVVSEPFGVVPYEAIYHWDGDLSPCARYDDPGLFESRGLHCLWRQDSTSIEMANGKYRWGEREREAFVECHNRLVERIVETLTTLAPHYERIVAYTTPTLTHRSFLADRAGRLEAGLPTSRRVGGRALELVGVGDLAPGLVEVLPSGAGLAELRAARGGRLPSDVLQQPDALAQLVGRIERCAEER